MAGFHYGRANKRGRSIRSYKKLFIENTRPAYVPNPKASPSRDAYEPTEAESVKLARFMAEPEIDRLVSGALADQRSVHFRNYHKANAEGIMRQTIADLVMFYISGPQAGNSPKPLHKHSEGVLKNTLSQLARMSYLDLVAARNPLAAAAERGYLDPKNYPKSPTQPSPQ